MFWSRPVSELDEIGRSWLVSEFECSSDWANWEMHPHADEFIYLLSGEALFQLQAEEGVTSTRLRDRGALVVPKGVWHTAKVATPSRMRDHHARGGHAASPGRDGRRPGCMRRRFTWAGCARSWPACSLPDAWRT